jgi:hypothetical protein
MHRIGTAIFLSVLSFSALGQQAAGNDQADKAWIKQSNDYTNTLLNVQLEHTPEQGSAQGVAKFDDRISDPSRADEVVARR